MDQLKSQLREYDECLAQMQQVNKELKAINQETVSYTHLGGSDSHCV